MLCDDTKQLVYDYLRQLRVVAINEEIRWARYAIEESCIEMLNLRGRWESYGRHHPDPRFPGPEENFGIEYFMRLRPWYNHFFLDKRDIARASSLHTPHWNYLHTRKSLERVRGGGVPDDLNCKRRFLPTAQRFRSNVCPGCNGTGTREYHTVQAKWRGKCRECT